MSQGQSRVAWPAWLDRQGIDQVVVISPHLDDAVLSLAGVLGAASRRTEVISLITAAPPGPVSDWTRATGFADNEAEYAARRQEDASAMARLGCRYRHEGLTSGDTLEAAAGRVSQRLRQASPGGLGRTLVLLPAGAGGPAPRSPLRRLVRRLLRRPSGAQPHGEHVQTRDHFWRALSGSGARMGFYAELPYAWSHSNQQLQEHLQRTLACQTERLEYAVDAEDKHGLVRLYASQLVPILGARPAYRRRVLARPECLLLVGGDGRAAAVTP